MEAAYSVGVKKLLFLGSPCIYPKMVPQPIAEDALLTGPLEPTNEWYAIAKIAGSSSRKRIAGSMVSTLFRQYRQIVTARTIITRCRAAM